ncbi:MAG: pyridoxamine 5'-phosphate oxidase family protein [Dehalococcoidia bacterium]
MGNSGERCVDPIIREIQAFMQKRHPEVTAFLVTTKRDGRPFIRQVNAFVDGWTVTSLSPPEGLKISQIRRNPAAAFLWVQQFPDRLARNVWVQGDVEIVEDRAEIDAFLDRRQRVWGQRFTKPPAVETVLLRLQPTFLRSEHFRENPREFMMREFPDLS